MKKIIFSLILGGASLIGFAQTQPANTAAAPAQPENAPDIKFVTENHDFGTIKEGTMATYEFKFTNTGKSDLILTNVQASCGCTTPSYTKEPVKAGANGSVTAVYNSNGRPGAFTKSITVTSNAKSGTKTLIIKGNVEAANAQPQSPVINQPN